MTIVHLFPSNEPAAAAVSHPAVHRLQGIAELVAAMNLSNLRTHADMMHAIWVLDLANQCIAIVLSEFQGAPATDHLRHLAIRLTKAIDVVRETLKALAPETTAARARNC